MSDLDRLAAVVIRLEVVTAKLEALHGLPVGKVEPLSLGVKPQIAPKPPVGVTHSATANVTSFGESHVAQSTSGTGLAAEEEERSPTLVAFDKISDGG